MIIVRQHDQGASNLIRHKLGQWKARPLNFDGLWFFFLFYFFSALTHLCVGVWGYRLLNCLGMEGAFGFSKGTNHTWKIWSRSKMLQFHKTKKTGQLRNLRLLSPLITRHTEKFSGLRMNILCSKLEGNCNLLAVGQTVHPRDDSDGLTDRQMGAAKYIISLLRVASRLIKAWYPFCFWAHEHNKEGSCEISGLCPVCVFQVNTRN